MLLYICIPCPLPEFSLYLLNGIFLDLHIFSNISLSDIYFLSSLGSNHGYFSFVSSFLPFINVLINLLNCSHIVLADLNL